MASKLLNFLGLAAKCAGFNYDAEWNSYAGQEYVVKLSDADASSWIQSQRSCLVFYYSKSCTYCESLKPQIANTASHLRSAGSKCGVACMDGQVFKQHVKSVMQVTEVPTINFYENGQFHSEYKFQRNAAAIIKSLKEKNLY